VSEGASVTALALYNLQRLGLARDDEGSRFRAILAGDIRDSHL
jgi:hypothetical protein